TGFLDLLRVKVSYFTRLPVWWWSAPILLGLRIPGDEGITPALFLSVPHVLGEAVPPVSPAVGAGFEDAERVWGLRQGGEEVQFNDSRYGPFGYLGQVSEIELRSLPETGFH